MLAEWQPGGIWKNILDVMTPTTPNLFRFATSELSQDAFICWLASWADPGIQVDGRGAAQDRKRLPESPART